MSALIVPSGFSLITIKNGSSLQECECPNGRCANHDFFTSLGEESREVFDEYFFGQGEWFGLSCSEQSPVDFFLHGILDHQGLPGGVLLFSTGVLAERLAAMLFNELISVPARGRQ